MELDDLLMATWLPLRERLVGKRLMNGAGAALSLRIPGGSTMWHGAAGDAAPRRVDWRDETAIPAAAVFAARQDVCAVLHGGGLYGPQLAGFGGRMPGVFDEQVRHLGLMAAARGSSNWVATLAKGGNAALHDGLPLVLGMTGARLALNAELFEKCAKAYVLALGAGGQVRPLPWIVRHVANGRLMRDEKRARERVAQGLLPEESKGY
ncbi:hypothetical protein [Rubrivivax gelatinosus]|uniref:Ribulose-5-phosphate 4-epimerase/fuculose-1-phosphate aldolase n=1 Tax=Rubrivivax gelatinosus (strain NBRC 100245 / IL144) TaxID=983917 RepID=I0HN73_RUBGI|nr:hypothetical protein [Rubrivivax gelatinosus]BAL94460.1 hypothetical protein RGE_11190 [Rubrivivax gelatinosus IL144]